MTRADPRPPRAKAEYLCAAQLCKNFQCNLLPTQATFSLIGLMQPPRMLPFIMRPGVPEVCIPLCYLEACGCHSVVKRRKHSSWGEVWLGANSPTESSGLALPSPRSWVPPLQETGRPLLTPRKPPSLKLRFRVATSGVPCFPEF